MRMSANGLELVKAFEGCHKAIPGLSGYFKAYGDPAGVLTIGYGHTNHHPPAFDENTIWSQAECDAALATDMERFEQHVASLSKVSLAQHEFDALVSWAFNTGGPATATLWKKLNAGDKNAVPDELRKWVKAGGKTLPGLVRRRDAEALMFQGKVAESLELATGKKVTPKSVIPAPTTVGAVTVAAGAAATAAGKGFPNVIAIMVGVLIIAVIVSFLFAKLRG